MKLKKKKSKGYLSVYFEPYSLKQNGLYKDFIESEEDWAVAISDNRIQRIMIKTPDFPLIEDHITSDMLVVQTRHGEKIVTHKDADKGNAAIKIASYFGIETSCIAAFGDDLSDFPMLKVCGVSVAMGNAVCEVKSVADYIIGTCDEDGIALWIEEHLLPAVDVYTQNVK